MRNLRDSFGGFGNRLFQLAYLYAKARKGEIPDIYLQDPAHFDEYREELRSILGSDLKRIDMVSLHVRRGDYTNNPFYVDLTQTDYYEKAMEQFPDATFLVFCADRQNPEKDEADMEWCKRIFVGDQFEFWRGESETDDFNMMASCSGHITANSSFSWWAAYVGGGETIAPRKWYADGRPGIPCPANWKLI